MCHRDLPLGALALVFALLLANHTTGSSAKANQIHLFGKTLTQEEHTNQPSPAGWPIVWEQRKLYLDSKCYDSSIGKAGADPNLLNDSPTGEVVKYLLKLKCDLKPLVEMFAVLLRHMDSTTSPAFGLQVDLVDMATKGIGMDQSKESVDIWREYSTFHQTVDDFVDAALALLGQRHFCTYTTIAKFGKLLAQTGGSRFLKLANDLVIIDYHSGCLMATIDKLPEVPYVVKDVVKIYIDGIDDTRRPDLNDPAYLELQATGFDIDAAIRQHGPIDQVASLMLTIPSRVRGGSLKELFVGECRELLMKLEEQWQPMEIMNQMLATESNSILQLNNLIMHSIIPQKYAQICSKLIMKA